MCQLLVEGDGGRRLRLELADLRRRRQRPARLRRHAHGDRLHDRAGGDRLLPGPGLDRARHDPDRPAPLETAALIARESGRPIIWNALLADGAVNQHGECRVPAPRAAQAARPPERGGRPPRLRPGADDQLRLGVHSRGLQPHGHRSRAGRRPASARSRRRSAKFADPERRPAMKEVHRSSAAASSARGYPSTEIKVNWISSDVPERSEAEGALRGLHHRRDRGPRGQAPARRHARRRRGRPAQGRLRHDR